MKNLHRLAGLVALLPLSVGCVGRTAPFDQMDRAQITVLRLNQPQPSALPTTGLPTLPTIPGLPDLQKLGQQALQGLQGMIPPSILPPGLIPGLPGATPAQPTLGQFKGFPIVQQFPVPDDGLKNELLDLFGSASSFNGQAGNCFTPGMGIVMQRPNGPEVDLLVSLTCNQVQMDGARWPYPVNGLTPSTRDHLSRIYEKIWGPVPPGT